MTETSGTSAIAPPATSGKLRVFISWSLPLAGDVAKILRGWLPRLIQDVEAWVSSKDIEKGKFWHREIIDSLQGSTVGIVVVTPANVDRPWLNFEAGAMARAIEPAGGVVMPLLINMRGSNISGPMDSLQVTRFEKSDFYGLVEAINARIRYPLSDEILREEFDAKWESLRKQVDHAVIWAVDEAPSENTAPPARPETDVLEDLVSAVRELRQDVRRSTGELAGPWPPANESAVRNEIYTMMVDSGITSADVRIRDVHRNGLIYLDVDFDEYIDDARLKKLDLRVSNTPRYYMFMNMPAPRSQTMVTTNAVGGSRVVTPNKSHEQRESDDNQT